MTVVYFYHVEYYSSIRRTLHLKCPMYYLDYELCHSHMMDMIKYLLAHDYEVRNYYIESFMADISHSSFKNRIVSPF